MTAADTVTPDASFTSPLLAINQHSGVTGWHTCDDSRREVEGKSKGRKATREPIWTGLSDRGFAICVFACFALSLIAVFLFYRKVSISRTGTPVGAGNERAVKAKTCGWGVRSVEAIGPTGSKNSNNAGVSSTSIPMHQNDATENAGFTCKRGHNRGRED